MISALLVKRIADHLKERQGNDVSRSDIQDALKDPDHPRHGEAMDYLKEIREKANANQNSAEPTQDNSLGR